MSSDSKSGLLEINTVIPADFELNDEFKQAFDLIENTTSPVFVTGKAGTGKSTLLEYFRENTAKNIVVLAPTGVAAIKVRGQTIHSFFKFPPRLLQKGSIHRLRQSTLIKEVETILIDEASMVRADLLDGIDYALRINRNEMKLPFGGVQMVFFGDLFQLPPVVEPEARDIMESLYTSPYFFSAEVMKSIDLKCMRLDKIYRQKDASFIDLLNKIRFRDVEDSDFAELNERVDTAITYGKGSIALTPTNYAAQRINNSCLKRIHATEYQYQAEVTGKFDERSYPTEACLSLKIGAQVMLVRNDKQKKWVNGTIAEVIDLSDDCIAIKIGECVSSVERVMWEKIAYTYNQEEKTIEEKILGTFSHYPIKLAWAITIHKSQGQTFNKVIIDMARGAFTHGQTYVALSRCTNLEGISLKRPITYGDIIFDDRVYEFHEQCVSTM